eukprot:CAMPEP_0179908480 /NCGR_PEP_ID=MMETSP0982-20121206/44568_1 /TAXON_ID=483367 /ORGANISM="non described non described, Strain CCMP 2436" /LENGTH=62 /DNA_ID=CAMNT_0021809593 /DNA_START=128 /DNA_END=316 /DNA_ORIENTATION=+
MCTWHVPKPRAVLDVVGPGVDKRIQNSPAAYGFAALMLILEYTADATAELLLSLPDRISRGT